MTKITVLANKFDQRDGNNVSKDDAKAFIAGLFSQNNLTVNLDNIYCVSARRAFYANFVANCIDDNIPLDTKNWYILFLLTYYFTYTHSL